MLSKLFGNRSIEKILFFLLVNEKCFAWQLHRQLETSLTPLQKALDRLEQEKVLISAREGKTRYYKFNTSYPLLVELENLLKKAFSLLSPHEKKRYYYINDSNLSNKEQKELVRAVYQKLQQISAISFTAKSGIYGKHAVGKAEVNLSYENPYTICFHEEGSWRGEGNQEFCFRNILRWTVNISEKMIALEHLRMGRDKPVFLFHLIPKGKDLLESIHSHLCGEDTYFGQLKLDKPFLHLNWRTIGPKKNEEIRYCYS